MIPPESIYEQDFNQINSDLAPPSKRLPKWLAWFAVLNSPLQWLRDLVFSDYANGSSAADWVTGTNYNYEDRVRYIDNCVYELQNVAGLSPSTVAPSIDTANWFKVLDTWVGARERARYTGQKLMLEYILNKIFRVTSYTSVEWDMAGSHAPYTIASAPADYQIYITNNAVPFNYNFWMSDSNNPVQGYMPNDSHYAKNYMRNATAFSTTTNFTIHVPIPVYNYIASVQPSLVTADDAIRAMADKYVQAGYTYNIVTY